MLKKSFDYRWILFPFLALFYAFPFIAREFDHSLYVAFWKLMSIPTVTYDFADLRAVIATWECAEKGISLYQSNPCDIFGRHLNHPPIWLLIGALNIDASMTTTLGLSLIGLFLISNWILVKQLGLKEAIVYLFIFVSPPVAFLLERGNNDIIIYSLLVAAIALFRLQDSRRWFGYPLIVVAGVLKLFPFAALASIQRERLPLRVGIGIVLAAFVYGYYVSILPYLPAMLKGGYPTGEFGIGLELFGWPQRGFFQHLVGHSLNDSQLVEVMRLIGVFIAAIPFLLGLTLGLWFPNNSKDSASLWIGAPTVLVIWLFSASWSYRLSQCLLLLPYIAAKAQYPTRMLNPYSLILLLYLLIFWGGNAEFLWREGWDEILTGILVVLASFDLGRSALIHKHADEGEEEIEQATQESL